ncbi:hypothetical protein PG997_015286 [Apiospora hydei]|uniref:Peptidase C14 caspase domain-containing protein n=1 Tax=Apiospora hydei TaxID=1337664 RepID=A0ABR1UQ58_9PEZI
MMASLEGGHASSSNAPPRVLEPHDPSAEGYQDADETRDSNLKALWDSKMGDLGSQYVPYIKVFVLLLSWHKEIDDLETEEELKVKALENILREKFKFETTREILTKDPKRSAQTQVNLHLAKFVFDNDDKDTLLIIYYAGHGFSDYGISGNDRDNLTLTPSLSLPGKRSTTESHEVVWNSADHIIRKTQADVLVIFDCCNAGQLERIRGHRAFEYLAATSANSTTKAPGDASFTNALIWSLDHLLEKQTCFSTRDLVKTINFDAPHFPEDQSPRLSDGKNPSTRKIMIAPLTNDSKRRAEEATRVQPTDNLIEERSRDLLLRFIFDCDITNSTVEETASRIRDLIQQGYIEAKAVAWEGIHSTSCRQNQYIVPGACRINYKDAAVNYFSDSLSRIRRRSSHSQTGEHHLLPHTSEAASRSADEMPVATPESSPSAKSRIGKAQRVPTRRALSPGSVGGDNTTLQLLSPLYSGETGSETEPVQPRRSKRKQRVGEDDTHGSSDANKRGRFNEKD